MRHIIKSHLPIWFPPSTRPTAVLFILRVLLIGAICHGIPLAILWCTTSLLFVAEVTFWKRLDARTPTSVHHCSATCPCLRWTQQGVGMTGNAQGGFAGKSNIYLLKPASYSIVLFTYIDKSSGGKKQRQRQTGWLRGCSGILIRPFHASLRQAHHNIPIVMTKTCVIWYRIILISYRSCHQRPPSLLWDS